MAEIIPPNVPPEPPNPPNTDIRKSIVCECCGSKLDRHGNLLRRGDLAKQMLDAEDTIDKLKKTIARNADDAAKLQQEIDSLRSQIPTQSERKSLWSREA